MNDIAAYNPNVCGALGNMPAAGSGGIFGISDTPGFFQIQGLAGKNILEGGLFGCGKAGNGKPSLLEKLLQNLKNEKWTTGETQFAMGGPSEISGAPIEASIEPLRPMDTPLIASAPIQGMDFA